METETRKILDELCLATHILVKENIIDGFGHVSVRNPYCNGHYYMLCDNYVEVINENNFVELDKENDPVSENSPRPSIERFIHGEIYRVRPDVTAIVHTHFPFFIPFGVSSTPLQPLYHMCGFLSPAVPVFDIEQKHGATNMLIEDEESGCLLAQSLGDSALILMRGHGATIVGSSIKEAVFRAIYSSINAQIQPVALQLGNPKYLSSEEALKSDELHESVVDRPWSFWKKKWDNSIVIGM